ncbi:MAG: DUF6599 family protein [Polyangiaceae bacterium]|nr:DUF6599 family protein [Polyangiaceae bacterium]
MRARYPAPGTSGSLVPCALLALSALIAIACDSESALKVLGRHSAPPQVLECESSPGEIRKTRLPAKLGSLCLASTAPIRSFGTGSTPLYSFCRGLLGTDCAEFTPFHLLQAEAGVYRSKHGDAAIDAVVLAFETPALAFGYFSRSVLASEDPRKTPYVALLGDGAAAQSNIDARAVTGNQVVILRLSDSEQPTERVVERARVLLPEAVRGLTRALGGASELPLEVRLLPSAGLLPLGMAYEPENVLDVGGLGPGAVGYYARGVKRWRLAAVDGVEEAAALDVVSTLRKFHGATVLKQAPFDALTFTTPRTEAQAPSTWFLTRRAQRVYAIGDDDFVGSRAQAEIAQLTESEKLQELGRFARSAEAIRK